MLHLKRTIRDVESRSVLGGQQVPPVAFAPEAHLPRERRLIIDGSGVAFETGVGVRHAIPWSECRAVLTWSDRAELVLNDEVSVVVRVSDWHQGSDALRAIRDRAPAGVLVELPDDPEPQPVQYSLRGLATSSAVVLILLAASLALVAALGLGIGEQDHRAPALIIGVLFAAATLGVLHALVSRMNVPRRFRAAAATRGRTSVAVDTKIAAASDQVLAVAEPALYATAGLSLGVLLAFHEYNLLPAIVLIGLAFAVRRERARRARRRSEP